MSDTKRDLRDRRERGLAVYKEMGWGENEVVKELDPDLWAFTTDVLFGEIWARPGLSLRERELITLGVLMAAKADGIALHMRNAHNLGISFDEIKEVILQCTVYLGMPKALFAMRKLKAVMAEIEAQGGKGP
jgi:alkylhydroperoxidase/carboxymuconolactone decarboxylase family protein YurZ